MPVDYNTTSEQTYSSSLNNNKQKTIPILKVTMPVVYNTTSEQTYSSSLNNNKQKNTHFESNLCLSITIQPRNKLIHRPSTTTNKKIPILKVTMPVDYNTTSEQTYSSSLNNNKQKTIPILKVTMPVDYNKPRNKLIHRPSTTTNKKQYPFWK